MGEGRKDSENLDDTDLCNLGCGTQPSGGPGFPWSYPNITTAVWTDWLGSRESTAGSARRTCPGRQTLKGSLLPSAPSYARPSRKYPECSQIALGWHIHHASRIPATHRP